MANIKLDKGPAKDIKAESLLIFFKLNGLNGTGLPHPKPVKSRNIIPSGSKCALGFRVTLPNFLGVSSPSL